MNFKNIKSPYVVILIGAPNCGKSTFIKNNLTDITIISRDNLILDLHNSNDYTKAYKEVDQKEVDSKLKELLYTTGISNQSAVIDMTHMTAKRRKYNLSFFKDHYKIAVVMKPLTKEEFIKRNEKRTKEENKHIPMTIYEMMTKSYQTPTKEEGFDKIILLK